MAFQVCTICTRSYLGQARVLYRSFRKFHPDNQFTALVFDARPGEVNEAFETCILNQIGLPPGEESRMPMLYNITELATALKPWFFRHLLSKNQSELLYFDPDIQFFSPVHQLAELASQHCIVLTPHTTQPMSRDNVRPNETDILSAGAYNLGFLGLNTDCGPFLNWWSERLLREAVIDVVNMRFTDQRWMDFAPGYFDTFILKDETCNVAYWNADSRLLTWNGNGYQVNDRPLCFFHFSGFRPENPHLLSFHQHINPRTRLSEHPVLARLCREYTEELNKAGYAQMRTLPYGLERTAGGLKITHPMRLAYREALQKHEELGEPVPPDPITNQGEFIAWLNQPIRAGCPDLTRYFWAIHDSRADLQAAFPNLVGGDDQPYYQWLRDIGRTEIPIPNELFPRPNVAPQAPAAPNGADFLQPGITLTGYLRSEAGTGQAGRLMVAAVQSSGERCATRIWTKARSRQNHPWQEHESSPPAYDTNLICINADQLSAFGREMGPNFFRNRYNIGLWFWEVELFPAAMRGAFDYLHEVWVTSDFVRHAIAKLAPIPVFTVPLPVVAPEAQRIPTSRDDLDLPPGFTFLFSFDFFSVAERKNPVAIIEAFKQAFRPGEGPLLVIKSINGDYNRAELERLHYARGDRTDILIRDRYLSAEETFGLLATSDCYVSLHRSEGFGLTLAEAMLLEKPTIATRYSGNLQFMNDANSFLCGYELRPVGLGNDPYPADARWAEPDIAEAAELMRFVYRNPDEARRRGQQARKDLCDHHNPTVAGSFIKGRLSQLRRRNPKAVGFAARHPEPAPVTALRATIEREADARRIVPSLLTWILQGPRRAMKRCLRAYDQHIRQVGVLAIDTFSEIDSEWRRARATLLKRLYHQEDEVHLLKKELKDTRKRLQALEKELRREPPASNGEPGSSERTGAATEVRPDLPRP